MQKAYAGRYIRVYCYDKLFAFAFDRLAETRKLKHRLSALFPVGLNGRKTGRPCASHSTTAKHF